MMEKFGKGKSNIHYISDYKVPEVR